MKYKVFKFPSYLGTPKTFRYLISAKMYAFLVSLSGKYVLEIENTETGEYTPYWM